MQIVRAIVLSFCAFIMQPAMADEVETAFTYGQDWPLGSALSIVLILIIGTLAIYGVSRVNLDEIMGRKR